MAFTDPSKTGFRKLFNADYPHDEQLKLCAYHLEAMRAQMGDQWWLLSDFMASKRNRTANDPHHCWTRERLGLAGLFVRLASESADYLATVDFVSKKAGKIIDDALLEYPNRSKGNLTQWDRLTHEHMVPGSVILKLLTEKARAANHGPLFDVLQPLCMRSLLSGTKTKKGTVVDNTGTDIKQLDSKYKSDVPKPTDIDNWPGPTKLADVPLCHLALLRYDAAKLLDEIIPLNTRAETALTNYAAYKASFSQQLTTDCVTI